jgi:hypothetical protein
MQLLTPYSIPSQALSYDSSPPLHNSLPALIIPYLLRRHLRISSWLCQAQVLTDWLGDGTGLGIELLTIEAVGQVTGVRGCRGEKGQLTTGMVPTAISCWRGSKEKPNLGSAQQLPDQHIHKNIQGQHQGMREGSFSFWLQVSLCPPFW